MTTDAEVKAEIAGEYWERTPEDFEDWLQHMDAARGDLYSLVLGAYLAGTISEDWFRDHAPV